MNSVVVFHGSPREGNTRYAANVFLDELLKKGGVNVIEFFMPRDLPVFCAGCTLCLGGMPDKCPNAQYASPILDAIINADALVFCTPHYGACSMPAAMKSLFDHIDFMVLNVSPREEMFSKKAFIITTGAGSAAAIKPIKRFLKNCGVNRVFSLGLRMYTNKWENLPAVKQTRFENALRRAAGKFYMARKGRPYISTVFFYYIIKHILMKKFIGEGNYPYDNWKEKGYFKRRPF